MKPAMIKKLQEAADECTIKWSVPNALFMDGGHFMYDELMPVVEILMAAVHRIDRMGYSEDGDHWDADTMGDIAEAALKQAKEMMGVKSE